MVMSTEHKQKLQALRDKLANLSPEQKQALTARGLIATVDGRVLSLHNTLLVYLQGNGITPSVVGGYQQWLKAGKQVNRGEHGMTIWFPVGERDSESGDIISADRFYTANVFDISQVSDKPITQ